MLNVQVLGGGGGGIGVKCAGPGGGGMIDLVLGGRGVK